MAGNRLHSPKDEMLRYEAEDIVRRTLMDSSEVKKEVSRVMKELKSIKSSVKIMPKKKVKK